MVGSKTGGKRTGQVAGPKTRGFKARAPRLGAHDNMSVALTLRVNLQEKASLRQFIEVHSIKALVSVKMLDQPRVVKELVGPRYLVGSQDAEVKEGPEKLALRKGERREQKVFVDTTRMNRKKWALTGARCTWRCVMELIRRNGSACATPCGRLRRRWASKKDRGAHGSALEVE